MKTKKKLIGMLILSFLLADVSSFAQRPLSLKECINYSITNNSNIKIAGYDVTISQKKVNEQIGTMLPQVDASVSYTDNLKLSTTVLPGELMGQPGTQIPVTMGTKHNLSGSVQLTQKIFDPTVGIALNAAKISKQLSEQTLQKTSEQTAYNISITYYQTLVIEKQMNSLPALVFLLQFQ